jgi:hypothetical protein
LAWSVVAEPADLVRRDRKHCTAPPKPECAAAATP